MLISQQTEGRSYYSDSAPLFHSGVLARNPSTLKGLMSQKACTCLRNKPGASKLAPSIRAFVAKPDNCEFDPQKAMWGGGGVMTPS